MYVNTVNHRFNVKCYISYVESKLQDQGIKSAVPSKNAVSASIKNNCRYFH